MLMGKRGRISATGLRARALDDKARIVAGVSREVWPLVEAGAIKPIIHTTLPLAAAQEAHDLMESSDHLGKILLLP
jgi:NADPH:quinone reductase-like Zn-dependent oxidoreductase